MKRHLPVLLAAGLLTAGSARADGKDEAVAYILSQPPHDNQGWQAKVDDDSIAHVWATDADTHVQVSYICDASLRFQALGLRFPAAAVRELPEGAKSVGIAIKDDVAGKVVSKHGKLETFSGGTLYTTYKLLPDPEFQGGMIGISGSTPLTQQSLPVAPFSRAKSRTVVSIYDAGIKGKPADEDLKLNIVFSAKGSTAAFNKALDYCGIKAKN